MAKDETNPPAPILLGSTQVGFNIGTTLPSTYTPTEKSSVKIIPTYDSENKMLKTAVINVSIPLNVSDASILSPIKYRDEKFVTHELSPGQIGIDGDTEIFDTGFARKVQNFIAIDTDGSGYLNIKVPIKIAAKIEQLD